MVIKLTKSDPYSDFLKNTDEPIALVLGRYMTLALGVLRSLAKKNIPLFVLDPMSKPISSFSKYYKGTLCPHPKHDEKKYIEFLLEFGEKLNTKAVTIPVGDIEVSVILRNKSKPSCLWAFVVKNSPHLYFPLRNTKYTIVPKPVTRCNIL